MPSIPPYQDDKLPGRFRLWLEELREILRPLPRHRRGTGSPEGVFSAGIGERYLRTDGTPGTDMLWYKSTDGGNTGWQAYG